MSFIWLSLISLFTLLLTPYGSGLKTPSIKIVSWIENDNWKWKSGNEMEIKGITYNDTTFIIPGDIYGVSILCNASFPVEWRFLPDEHLTPNVEVMSMFTSPSRQGDGSSNRPYSFSIKLFLFGNSNLLTGKYICLRSGNYQRNQQRSEMYLFWEGNSPPYLIGSGKKIRVSSHNKATVRLPCPVSFPEADVFLQKKTNVTKEDNSTEAKFVLLDYNTNTTGAITYDPSVGFILDNTADQNKSIDGEYQCLTTEKDDVITIQVTPVTLPEPPKSFEKDILEGTAKLYFNKTSQLLVCCSNSDKPPQITIFYCSSYSHCQLTLPLLKSNMVYGHRQYAQGGGISRNCAATYIYQGGLRCTGDGIDVTRTMFSSYKNYNNGSYIRTIFWSWADITTEIQQDLITVYIQVISKPDSIRRVSSYSYFLSENGKDSVLYKGQNLTVTCQPANFYFAEGVIWRIKWKNGTKTNITPPNTGNNERNNWYYIQPTSVTLPIDPEMFSVQCSAPIWNATGWASKEHTINAKVPTPPVISSINEDNVYWTLNETEVSIHCEATGDPVPQIYWLRNGKILSDSNNIELVVGNQSLTLKFKLAEYSIHGSYLCLAENLASRAEKMFNIFVEEPHPWVATIVITVIVLAFLTVIGILGWRVKVTHDAASELRWRTS